MIGRRTAVKLLGIGIAAAGLSTTATRRAAADTWRWQEILIDGPAPPPRVNGMLVHDAARGRLLLFGGGGAAGPLNDLWSFDLRDGAWRALDAGPERPAPRLGHNAVLDPDGPAMIVWAGQMGSRFFNDTWALDLETLNWRDVSPAQRPSVRYGAAAVFDPAQRRLVTFAGFTDRGRFQDTQAFSLPGGAWDDLTPAGTKPEVRCLLTAAFDRSANRMVIYAGQRTGPLDDLWAFDLSTRDWTDLTPAQRPPGRFFSSSFLSAEGSFVIFGGRTSSGPANDTWTFDFGGGQWQRLTIDDPPPARDGMSYAYAETERQFFVFGGSGTEMYNDLWALTRA